MGSTLGTALKIAIPVAIGGGLGWYASKPHVVQPGTTGMLATLAAQSDRTPRAPTAHGAPFRGAVLAAPLLLLMPIFHHPWGVNAGFLGMAAATAGAALISHAQRA